MHRTGSTTRVAEELFQQQQRLADKLPTYDPISELAKKEASKVRSAENAVHIIPFVLIACALILWFFSTPYVPVENKDHPLMEGKMKQDSFGNETSSVLETDSVMHPVEHVNKAGTSRRKSGNRESK